MTGIPTDGDLRAGWQQPVRKATAMYAQPTEIHWHFARGHLPRDVAALVDGNDSSGKIGPSNWKIPFADFPNTGCPIERHFRNQSIITNIDICGQWAGLPGYYSDESQCPGSCAQYAFERPGIVYEEAYWEFGSWWVFQAA